MIFFFKLKMLYPFLILCLQRKKKKNSTNLSCSTDFKLALGLFFLEEIMQLFWGTRLSPLPGRRCSTFQAVPSVKSVPSGGCWDTEQMPKSPELVPFCVQLRWSQCFNAPSTHLRSFQQQQQQQQHFPGSAQILFWSWHSAHNAAVLERSPF